MPFAIAPIACVASYIAWFHLAPASFAALLQGELGLVELGTTVLFFVAGVRAFRIAMGVKATQRAAAALLFGLAAVAIFIALEEVSYGQQFVHWKSPAFFAEHNAQGETNLHNLLRSRPGNTLHRIAEYASLLIFVALPLWNARRAPHPLSVATTSVLGHYGRSLGALVPRFELVPLVALTWLVAAGKSVPGLAPDLNELRELLWGWSLLGYVTIVSRQLEGDRLHRERH